MDITTSLKEIDKNLLIFILTSLFAFISWLIKGIIEKPINEAKITFEKTYTTRIEILTEIKNRLSLILYFNSGYYNLDYKNQIQNLLLKDGKSAYLSKEILDNILRISIDETNNNNLIQETISKIDTELYLIISKIEDEISFYRKFSNYNPLKKVIGILLLALQNIITILLISLVIFLLVFYFIKSEFCGKALVIIVSLVLLIFSNWYLSKK
ncbi:hypothetical protein [Chishuiella sp.]|uniref:hypothetical protein n=1 Tax=Chishuiella sp. TaxID=1969467 RepID=UPI0028AAA010|nr:hypothetical protein [Chishuiella sp.]